MKNSVETSPLWKALERELDLWGEDQNRATFWWRDDDAQQSAPQLDRLIKLSATSTTPLVLATIPCDTEAFLTDKLAGKTNITIVQHGWSHTNHATASEKKCELGDHRELSDIQQELANGGDILKTLFGNLFLPVLVPPWNRISTNVSDHLKDFGYLGLSTFGDDQITLPAPGFCQKNTHVDLINWRQGRGFIGIEDAMQQMTSHLQQRRLGQIPRGNATGILTHHLVHDEDLWQFLEALFHFTARHPAVQWQTGRQVFLDEKTRP